MPGAIFNCKGIFSGIIILLISSQLFSQVIIDKNKGNPDNTKKGFMDGNFVGTVYYNFGEVGDYLNEKQRSGVWPKGTDHIYLDGVAIIVQAETVDPSGRTIHPLETNYYEFTRYNPQTGITYGWWPLPGYANPFNSSPARSDDYLLNQKTWPDHWPDRPSNWDGVWNGFFGKGVMNADLETYFVFDDDMDREYLLRNSFYPDEDDPTRGGLGMQVKTRGFQWSHVLAADVIFWYYEITNMGTTDYDRTLFAQYVDWGIGGANSNGGSYDDIKDMSYAWSIETLGSPGGWGPVGMAGYAFLESPGISDDRRDNDKDGLTDERRDNEPLNFIETLSQDPFVLNTYQDTTRFREFYDYSWQPHWDADENANWRSYFDMNDNGVYDEGEALYDDVGTDGIGSFNVDYEGPDPDGTEGNGRPDQGEPNFGILDKDESDQLGLTGFLIYAVHDYELNKDDVNWTMLSSLPTPMNQQLLGVNLANSFSSYIFHMYGRYTYSNMVGETSEIGETERFSMALIFGMDKNDLFRRKNTVQKIYNAHYRFAKPPDKPILKAIAGDNQVTLYWDNRAELSFDAFYQKYNFEGYRIYRSTEANFLENLTITDAFGKTTFKLPIAQFDLNDGVKGLHPIPVNGAYYDLGTDTGLKHFYIDNDVQNGQTYYYAVCAYDQGFTTTTVEGIFEGIAPAETASIIKVDINGEVITDINTAVVTPRPPALGYIPPEISSMTASGPGTGSISIDIIEPDSIRYFYTYRLEFIDSSVFYNNPTPMYQLIDYSNQDTLIEPTSCDAPEIQTHIFHGYSLNIKNDTAVEIDMSQSRWTDGNSNYIVQVGFDDTYAGAYNRYRVDYPADFEIELTEPGQGEMSFPATTFSQPEQTNIIVHNLTENIEHMQFIFRDVNKNGLFEDQDVVFIVFGNSPDEPATGFNNLHVSWSVKFLRDTAIAETNQIDPEYGDRYKIITKKPFRNGEYFEFTSVAQSFNKGLAVSSLSEIAVVPNPYVGAASWEPSTVSVGRGERRIYFINLPQVCTIRIYTLSGKHVVTLEHQSTLTNGHEAWNLISKDGMEIAYGVYVYHVETPDSGEKIGKFAVIK